MKTAEEIAIKYGFTISEMYVDPMAVKAMNEYAYIQAEQAQREERERNIELLSWILNHSAFSNEMWIEEVCEKVEEALAAAGYEGKEGEQ